jgi:glycosyltransferase involved in cell wall biosynthesis
MPMTSICAVVPVFNHEHAIGGVVASLRERGLAVILVDDGSGPSCAAELGRLARTDAHVRLLRLPENQGKGAAVMAGLAAAASAGYSHALQIDADGQHDPSGVPRFVAAAEAEPQALICGRPVFDASIPRHRLYLRYLTHVMVWINTLSFEIPDAMCGLRVYPLAIVLPILNAEPPGRRMDFDVEALVRFHWHGVRMRWLPIRVAYPVDGLSHFRLVRDNWLITLMHTRLFFGMLWRSPRLLARRLRATSAGEPRVIT